MFYGQANYNILQIHHVAYYCAICIIMVFTSEHFKVKIFLGRHTGDISMYFLMVVKIWMLALKCIVAC